MKHDRHYPTDDERDEREAERRLLAKVEQDRADKDFQWLMSSVEGRRIVWRELSIAGVFRGSFSTNAMQMAFNEGEKNQGLRWISNIHRLCPDKYVLMMHEAARNQDD